ncbi:GNAT family N-acetyltransferase [Streptomyces mayteni]
MTELFLLRAAGPVDLDAALALHRRCSPDALAGRYHGPLDEADDYLPHLLGPRHGRALAARTLSGRLVGLGHLLWDGAEAEVALLVEDAWQRRGVGSSLLHALVEMAAREQREAVYAVCRPADPGMAAVMRAVGLSVERHPEEDALVLSARLTALPTAAASPARARG